MKKTTQTPARPVGRPSSYKPEYPEKLFEHMAEGLSFECFGGRPEVKASVSMLYNWLEAHPDFQEAKKLGETASRYFWEIMGIDGAKGKIQGFNLGGWIFNMKNRFFWRDKQDFEITGANGGSLQIDVAKMTEEQMLKELEELEAKRKSQLRIAG